MLRKSPGGRPTLARCAEVLASISEQQNACAPSRAALDRVAAAIAEREARAEADRQAQIARLRERQEVFDESVKELNGIRTRLFKEIALSAHGASSGFGHTNFR